MDYNSLNKGEIHKSTSPYVNTWVNLWSGIMTSIQINTLQTFLLLWNGQASFHSGKCLGYSPDTGRRPMPLEMRRASWVFPDTIQWGQWGDSVTDLTTKHHMNLMKQYHDNTPTDAAKPLACNLQNSQSQKSPKELSVWQWQYIGLGVSVSLWPFCLSCLLLGLPFFVFNPLLPPNTPNCKIYLESIMLKHLLVLQ